MASSPITHGVWYAYDEPTEGGLFDPTTGQLLAGAAAWSAVNAWIVGSTIVTPCAATGTGMLWSCGLRLANGENALAIWDASSTCSGSSCTTSMVAVPAGGYTHYRDLAAGVTASAAGTVPVSLAPILLTVGE
jgi:hypothetical protein